MLRLRATKQSNQSILVFLHYSLESKNITTNIPNTGFITQTNLSLYIFLTNPRIINIKLTEYVKYSPSGKALQLLELHK